MKQASTRLYFARISCALGTVLLCRAMDSGHMTTCVAESKVTWLEKMGQFFWRIIARVGLWVRFKLFEMKEFRRFELHKFTAGILKIQASPPRFKRCLRGEKSIRAWHCPSIFGMLKYLLWPTYFALATEFFLHSFPVSITDDELPARNYRRTLKAPIQDQLQSCTKFFAGICQRSPHNLS